MPRKAPARKPCYHLHAGDPTRYTPVPDGVPVVVTVPAGTGGYPIMSGRVIEAGTLTAGADRATPPTGRILGNRTESMTSARP